MKDAKGHGSDARGAHTEGVSMIGQRVSQPIGQLIPTQDPLTNAPLGSQNLQLSTGATYDMRTLRAGSGAPLSTANNQRIIDAYRFKIRTGAPIDPLLVTESGHVVNGAHRLAAYRAEGHTSVPTEILKGAKVR